MSKNIVLILDKGVFDVFFDSEIDAFYCDTLETLFGDIILSQDHYMKLYETVDDKFDEYFVRQNWQTYLDKYHDSFLSILAGISEEHHIKDEAIQKDLNAFFTQFKTRIKAINPGTANDDIFLVAISCLINKYTDFVPAIISEDSDLLIQAQLLCSLYGLPSMIQSVFELVSSTSELAVLDKYLKNKGILSMKSNEMNGSHSKDECLRDLSVLCQKNLIAFHPSLGSGELFYKSTRTKRLK